MTVAAACPVSTNDKMSVLELSTTDCETWFRTHGAFENASTEKRPEKFHELLMTTMRLLGFKATRHLIETEIEGKDNQMMVLAAIVSASLKQ